jgi:DNA invertase Pin-like site-specific DNA recombinase
LYIYIGFELTNENKKKMEQIGLKQNIIDTILNDIILHAKIALVLGVSNQTVYRALKDNHPKLTQAGVLKVIREHLNIKKDSELITEIVNA